MNEQTRQLAEQAGFYVPEKYDGIGYFWCSDEYPIDEQLLRLLDLVREDEREACAKLAELAEPYQAADLIRKRGKHGRL